MTALKTALVWAIAIALPWAVIAIFVRGLLAGELWPAIAAAGIAAVVLLALKRKAAP